MSTLRTNLVSWWSMNELSGTRVDSHGTVNLTDNNTVGNAAGKQGNGADFESTFSEFLNANNSVSTPVFTTGDYTLSMWYKPESLSSTQVLFCINGSGETEAANSQIIFRVNSNGSLNMFHEYGAGNNSNNTTSATPISSTGTWYHIILQRDISNGRYAVYVDNTFIEFQSFSDDPTGGTAGNISIGSYQTGGGDYVDGIIDEVGFWHTLLDSSQRSELYNSGNGITYADTAPAGVEAVFIPKVSFIG